MSEAIETLTQVFHVFDHPMGTGDACDRCRAKARRIVERLGKAESDEVVSRMRALLGEAS